MKRVCLSRVPLLLFACSGAGMAADLPVANREPLHATPFICLDLGSIKARGWLENQLRLQAEGLTGHAEEVIPELGPDSGWLGGKGESWEKGPYYIRGLVSLAWESDDPKLRKQAQKWIEALLSSQREDGQIGPASSNDWWPRMPVTWALRDYYEATGDARVIPALLKYARYMQQHLPQQPLEEWAKARAADQIDTLYWLYNRTGEASLLDVAEMLRTQANRWDSFFTTLQGAPGDFRSEHGVNVSQAMKYPVVTSLRKDAAQEEKGIFESGWSRLQKQHGLGIGMWSGTESLTSRSTTQGIEMCSIVEQMLSSERAMAITGEPVIGDQLERIAFNLLPGGTTKDFKQFQYYTLPNIPVAHRSKGEKMPFQDDHGDDLMCGPHSGFHCCCYNLHMGWPKYVQHTWMGTSDGGLAAVAYGPTEVKTRLGGALVSIVEETNYPFEDGIRFTVNPGKAIAFPLKLRIPGWSPQASVTVNGTKVNGVRAGQFLVLNRTWQAGDKVVAQFPAEVEAQTSFRGSASLWRGPLVFTLKIGEKATSLNKVAGGFDDLNFDPTTPWNYALDLDRATAASSVKLARSRMPQNPWLPETTPISLSVPARRLPQWGLIHQGLMADEVPESPVKSDQPLEQVTLVPFGAQTLRITDFPLLKGAPIPEPGLTASFENGEPLAAILTSRQPSSSLGQGIPRFTFWSHTGTQEWLRWTFDKAKKISSVSVYWFDDTGSGKCRIPASWRVLYRHEGEWLPVAHPTSSAPAKDQLNTLSFDPIETTDLRIEVQLQDGYSAGLLQLQHG